MAAEGILFDVRRFSVHDGPGIRTTVFLKGCPLNCWWCHNPESQRLEPEFFPRDGRCIRCGQCIAICPQGCITATERGVVTDPTRCTLCGRCVEVCPAEAREIAGRKMNLVDLMAEIKRDRPFFEESGGGVTVSGGEPLMQPAFLETLLSACRDEEIHTALDTSGYAPWERLERMLPLVNLFLYDMKTTDSASHLAWTGVGNKRIVENLEKLSARGAKIELRMPVIPGLNDSRESLRAVAELAGRLHVLRLDLLPYHSAAAGKYARLGLDYRLAGTRPPSEDWMQSIAEQVQRWSGVETHIGG